MSARLPDPRLISQVAQAWRQLELTTTVADIDALIVTLEQMADPRSGAVRGYGDAMGALNDAIFSLGELRTLLTPRTLPDPHADSKSMNNRPCLHEWDCAGSWRPHMCQWGRGHLMPHKCEACDAELPR